MFAVIPWKLDKTGTPGKFPGPGANLALIAANVLIYFMGWHWVVGRGASWTTILLYGFSHMSLWHLVLNM